MIAISGITTDGVPLEQATRQENVNVFVAPVLALKLQDAAKALSVSRWTIRRMIMAGEIRATPYKTVAIAELNRYLAEASSPRRR